MHRGSETTEDNITSFIGSQFILRTDIKTAPYYSVAREKSKRPELD